jgi:hypothetical protein
MARLAPREMLDNGRATGRYATPDRALELHRRHTLGIVRDAVGGDEVDHRDWVAFLCGRSSHPGYLDDRLILFKDDGSLCVHAEKGYQPLNYDLTKGRRTGRADLRPRGRQRRHTPIAPHANAKDPSTTITRVGKVVRSSRALTTVCCSPRAATAFDGAPNGTIPATAWWYAGSELFGTLLQLTRSRMTPAVG